MKLFIAVCIFALIALTYGTPVEDLHPRGCIYIMGKCHRECEVGTHAYTTGCSQRTPEATCDEPNPVAEEGDLCDFSACYCDPPTVRNASGKCVPLSECPKKKE